MITAKSILMLIVISITIVACKSDDLNDLETVASLVRGQWNMYETGVPGEEFTPGILNNLTLVYESGIVFSPDGKFGSRYYYEGVWTENLNIGDYIVKDDRTIVLTYNPGTMDESKLELQIIKINKDHLWFQHRYWVNENNPVPLEHHLERVKS
jgi:hypothetical protein